MRTVVWLILLLAISSQAFAQQHIKEQIQNLDKDFRSFKYRRVIEKGKFLLSDPYVTKEDSLTIYKYMLNAAYALADTVEAKNVIRQIIKCDPKFVLNPQETSPKIIEFFNHVKNQIRHHIPIIPTQPSQNEGRRRKPLVYRPLPLRTMLYSVLLPGNGHLYQNFIGKGIRFTGISLGLIGGIAYTAVQTTKRHDAYMRARQGADFNRLYDDYNRMYKIRNLLIGAFVAWDIYVLFDLQKEWQISLQPASGSDAVSLRISKRW